MGHLQELINLKKISVVGNKTLDLICQQYKEEEIKKTNELLDVVSQIGEKHQATNAQMSLAWMINKYDFIIPIPGSRKLDRLQSNFEAGNVELSQEEVKTIDDKLNTMEFKVFGGH